MVILGRFPIWRILFCLLSIIVATAVYHIVSLSSQIVMYKYPDFKNFLLQNPIAFMAEGSKVRIASPGGEQELQNVSIINGSAKAKHQLVKFIGVHSTVRNTRPVPYNLTNPTVVMNLHIAVVLAITFKKVGVRHYSDLRRAPFFHILLKSFCKTASPGFQYSFYLAYDKMDHFLGSKEKAPNSTQLSRHTMFRSLFNETTEECSFKNVSLVSLKFVACNYASRPAWSQNDASMAAYFDQADFFYRVNDDTKLVSKAWTEIFIQVLQNFRPPLLGVVGPSHSGGTTRILTHDFVHRTHIDVFGFHYPSVFTDWYADAWITRVYLPRRSSKTRKVKVVHSRIKGTRYSVSKEVSKHWNFQVERDKLTIGRYLRTINYTTEHSTSTATSKQVTKKPSAEQKAKKPSAKEKANIPSAKQKARKPIAKQKAVKPSAKQKAKKSTAKQMAKKSTAKPKARKPVAKLKAEKSIAKS